LVVKLDKEADKIRKNHKEKRVWGFHTLGGPEFMLEENVFACSVKPIRRSNL
jgi:hypothetical protein